MATNDADTHVSLGVNAPGSSTQAFREAFRRDHPRRLYNGWVHFAFTTSASLFAIVAMGFALEDVTLLEWVVVPVAFLISNVVEYAAHRWPMHRPTRGLRLLWERHTAEHHRWFTARDMVATSPRDFDMVLFPPVMALFFIGFIATSLMFVLRILFSANAGWLFAIVVFAYLLTYETLHLAYHLDPQSLLGRLPFMDRLRMHHTLHHDPKHMRIFNFNVTFPVADRMFGTHFVRSRIALSIEGDANGRTTSHVET